MAVLKALWFVIKGLIGLIGVALYAAAIMCLIFLGMVVVSPEGLAGRALGEVWFRHDPFFFATQSQSIQLVQVFFERKLALPMVWNPGITTVLNWPSWLGLLFVTLVLFIIGTLLVTPLRKWR